AARDHPDAAGAAAPAPSRGPGGAARRDLRHVLSRRPMPLRVRPLGAGAGRREAHARHGAPPPESRRRPRMPARLPWSGLFADEVDGADQTMARLLRAEESRQRTTVNLIASESYCPRATIEAEASLLVNKNASGYPGRRDVGGCEVFDEIERLAISRAR